MSAILESLGVCSWSLQPNDHDDLVASVGRTGLSRVQLALDPLREGRWGVADLRSAFDAAGLEVVSGMMGTIGEDYTTLETIARTGGVRPDEHWSANLEAAKGVARVACELGLGLVTFHAGFLPETAGEERTKLLDRLQTVARVFADAGIQLGFETGQESAETLEEVLNELNADNVGVNFDPANMVLYDKDEPVAALERLLPHVLQIHVKDATRTSTRGTWGAEVPVGSGDVDWVGFCRVLQSHGWQGDLIVEREAGEARVADVRTAVEVFSAAWDGARA